MSTQLYFRRSINHFSATQFYSLKMKITTKNQETKSNQASRSFVVLLFAIFFLIEDPLLTWRSFRS